MKKDNTWKIKMERIRRSKLWAGDMALVAVRILEYLEVNGKTQKWLADQLEVTPQQITKVVKGRQNLSWGKIKEIEKVLGIKLVRIEQPTCNAITAINAEPATSWDVHPSADIIYDAIGCEMSEKKIKVIKTSAHTHKSIIGDEDKVFELGQYELDQSKRFAVNC